MSRNKYDPSTGQLTPIGGWQSVDDALSSTSLNPLANKRVKEALDTKADSTSLNGSVVKTSAAKTGTAQSSITNTIAASITMDNAVGTLLNNDKTLDTNLASLKETKEKL